MTTPSSGEYRESLSWPILYLGKASRDGTGLHSIELLTKEGFIEIPQTTQAVARTKG